MRPKQIEWARRRWKVGGACYWLLQVGDGGTREIYLLTGNHGRDIETGLTEAQLNERSLLRFRFGDRMTPDMVILTMARGCVG
jgi:hypothetical protein